jgi:hypothetical protein
MIFRFPPAGAATPRRLLPSAPSPANPIKSTTLPAIFPAPWPLDRPRDLAG